MANSLGYELKREDSKGPEGDKVKAKIQQDYARVDIYYQTLDVKLIRQIPVISVRIFLFDQIISNYLLWSP